MSEPLAAGAELDAKVAQQVLGWRVYRIPHTTKWVHDDGNEREWLGRHGPDVPPFSTDWGAAMKVFETMVERVGWGSLRADMEDARGQGLPYWVQFGTIPPVCAPGPLAICRAALAAVEQDDA